VPRGARLAIALLAPLLTLTLILAPRGEAFVYWSGGDETIGRANLDGTGADESYFTAGAASAAGVAVDASHIYWANADFAGTIGRATLDGTGVDESFPWGVAVDALRSFGFGKVKPNKNRGTAKLTLKVPGPGDLELAKTKRVRGARERAGAAGRVKLPVQPRGKAKRELKVRGKAKVEAEVTYTPDGDDPTIVASTLTKALKLVKRG